jgi:parvulin-like peptidyl-prolyl isomerase
MSWASRLIAVSACCLLGLGLGLALGPQSAAQPQAYGVAARVNGAEISNEILERSFEEYLRDNDVNVGSIRNPERFKAMKRAALDLLIEQELAWQSAQKKGTVATEQEVAQALQDMQAQFKSRDDFIARLEIEGYNEETYKEHLKHLVSASKYLDQVARAAKVTDADVHEFYRNNPAKFSVPELAHARHILIKLQPDASEEARKAARGKLAAVLKEARGGADFGELARKHSEDSTAQSGGDLGLFPRGSTVKPFEDAAFALKPGAVSEIVETSFGLHIIELEEIQPARVVPEAEAAARIREYLEASKKRDAVKAELARLRSAAKVEILLPL